MISMIILWLAFSYGAYRTLRYFFFKNHPYDGSNIDKLIVGVCVIYSVLGPVSLISALVCVGIDRVFKL